MSLIESSVFACVVPGCFDRRAQPGSAICVAHFAQASAPARVRFLTALRRVSALRAIWNDPSRYDRVVASGRYLKLVHASALAEDALDVAAQTLTLAVIAAQARPYLPADRRSA